MKAQKIMALAVAVAVASGTSHAQMLTVLHTFSAYTNYSPTGQNGDGALPLSDLVLSGNTLYGTTPQGGSYGLGTIFSMNTDGSGFTVLHTFTGTNDGDGPKPHLLLEGGTLYGELADGTNAASFGGVFSMETNGSNFTVLYNFNTNTDGAVPGMKGGLTMSGGTLYGTAYEGGITNAGSIFSVDTNGTFQLLHLFQGNSDGSRPLGTLVLSSNVLYGTAAFGGTNPGNFGTVFSISTAGTNFTVLHTFGGITAGDGSAPNAGVILSGNTLYGITSQGGTNNDGTVFSINTDRSGYTVLHSFAGLGEFPQGALWLHGNTLYGTALGNGTTTQGSVFSIRTNGNNFTLLQTFSHLESTNNYTNTYGTLLRGSLAMAGNVLYGSAQSGGAYGNGTIFSLAIQPVISSLDLDGTTAVLNAANGFTGNTWSVLESPDLSLPLADWTPIATNTLSADGDFSITATNAIDPNAAQEFYLLEQQ